MRSYQEGNRYKRDTALSVGLGAAAPRSKAHWLSSSRTHYCMALEWHPVVAPCVSTIWVQSQGLWLPCLIQLHNCFPGHDFLVCSIDARVPSLLDGCRAVSHVPHTVQAQRKNGITLSHPCHSSKVCLLHRWEGLSWTRPFSWLRYLPLRNLRVVAYKEFQVWKNGVIPHFRMWQSELSHQVSRQQG